ncbi:hypothetical protein IW256_000654 [Actinomadura viridis]|uniref:Uncharacterized protein n=1 Tax=Actinomadura viridis TaxID=58110 RepID=A0A931GKL7_9ACTN|nr:hypothetical protein [Actinomadura viridis]
MDILDRIAFGSPFSASIFTAWQMSIINRFCGGGGGVYRARVARAGRVVEVTDAGRRATAGPCWWASRWPRSESQGLFQGDERVRGQGRAADRRGRPAANIRLSSLRLFRAQRDGHAGPGTKPQMEHPPRPATPTEVTPTSGDRQVRAGPHRSPQPATYRHPATAIERNPSPNQPKARSRSLSPHQALKARIAAADRCLGPPQHRAHPSQPHARPKESSRARQNQLVDSQRAPTAHSPCPGALSLDLKRSRSKPETRAGKGHGPQATTPYPRTSPATFAPPTARRRDVRRRQDVRTSRTQDLGSSGAQRNAVPPEKQGGGEAGRPEEGGRAVGQSFSRPLA